MGQCNVSIERHPPPRRFEARPSSVTRAAAPTQRPPARCPMGYTHIPPEQKRHAYRQRSAGVSYGTIKRNQRIKFGTDALTMSKSSIQRAFKGGRAGNAAPPCTRVVPGRTLLARHRELLRKEVARLSESTAGELSAFLATHERCHSRRTKFAESTINDFLRDEELNTYKCSKNADAEPLGPAQPEAPEHPLPRQCQPAALAALPSGSCGASASRSSTLRGTTRRLARSRRRSTRCVCLLLLLLTAPAPD